MGFLKTRADQTSLYQVKDVYTKGAAAVQEGGAPALENRQQSALNDVMRDKSVVGSVIKDWVKEGT